MQVARDLLRKDLMSHYEKRLRDLLVDVGFNSQVRGTNFHSFTDARDGGTFFGGSCGFVFLRDGTSSSSFELI